MKIMAVLTTLFVAAMLGVFAQDANAGLTANGLTANGLTANGLTANGVDFVSAGAVTQNNAPAVPIGISAPDNRGLALQDLAAGPLATKN